MAVFNYKLAKRMLIWAGPSPPTTLYRTLITPKSSLRDSPTLKTIETTEAKL